MDSKSRKLLDNTNLPYYDFFHFNTQPLPVLFNDYNDAFMMPAYYSLSTPEAFAEVHIKYTTPYLLIKLLPVISNTLMRENLSFPILDQDSIRTTQKLDIPSANFLLVGEIGVYAGFDDLQIQKCRWQNSAEFLTDNITQAKGGSSGISVSLSNPPPRLLRLS